MTMVGRLRNVYSRDLIIEEVDPQHTRGEERNRGVRGESLGQRRIPA